MVSPALQAAHPGHLYVVATPIGNLGDLSPRAQQILASVDLVCAEDTRTSALLLDHFGIRRPFQALHEHNEDRLTEELVDKLKGGTSLALVSDAGTPLISDPGFALVRAARAAGCIVIAVPGPCAAIAALSISGLPSDSFAFAGFLPPKAAARLERLRALAAEERTLIFYEASHRIVECVAAIAEAFGADRPLFLGRELTKRFEESVTAPAARVLEWLRADANRERGEFVLIAAGAAPREAGAQQAEDVLRVLCKELAPSQAARLAAQLTGLRKNELYALAMKLGGGAVEHSE